LEPVQGDTIYDPTGGSGGMLVHAADYLRESGHHANSVLLRTRDAWGNAAIGRIKSVLHGLEADIKAGSSTITDPQFLDHGQVKKFSLVLANFPFSDECCGGSSRSSKRTTKRRRTSSRRNLGQGGLPNRRSTKRPI
jgi:type I restriction enzyme M protein